MKQQIVLILALICLIPVAGCYSFGGQATIPPNGRALFESRSLGVNGRSCATCHPGGKGLDKVGDFSDAELRDIINACIRDALHGARLGDDSPDLADLVLYVRSFQPAGRH